MLMTNWMELLVKVTTVLWLMTLYQTSLKDVKTSSKLGHMNVKINAPLNFTIDYPNYFHDWTKYV